LVRQYINEDALVDSIDISNGTEVNIVATVRDPDQYAAFLLNLRRAAQENGGTLFKGLPTAEGPGGFANGAALLYRRALLPKVSKSFIPSQSGRGNATLSHSLPVEPGGAAPAAILAHLL
jgi:hypothetical protein